MKKILLMIACISCLLMSCQNNDNTINREQYLNDKLDSYLNERLDNDYEILAESNLQFVQNESQTTSVVKRLLKVNGANEEFVVVTFGNDNANTLGFKDEDKFFCSLDNYDELINYIESDYPNLAFNTKYYCKYSSIINEKQIDIALSLSYEQLNDIRLMEEISNIAKLGGNIAVLREKDKVTEQLDLIKPYLLSALYGMAYDYNPYGKDNPVYEDFIYIKLGTDNYGDNRFETIENITAENVKDYLMDKWIIEEE